MGNNGEEMRRRRRRRRRSLQLGVECECKCTSVREGCTSALHMVLAHAGIFISRGNATGLRKC